jgi:hypothetical protein
MVESTLTANGDEILLVTADELELPEILEISTAEARRIPSPGAASTSSAAPTPTAPTGHKPSCG